MLHDVIDDAGVKAHEIKEYFGEGIAMLVADESEDKREDLPAESTWKLRKIEALMNFRYASRAAQIIALGDKLSNIRAIHRDYEEIGDELWKRFNCKDKSEQAWYYNSLSNMFSELSGTEALKEYNERLEAVFGKKA